MFNGSWSTVTQVLLSLSFSPCTSPGVLFLWKYIDACLLQEKDTPTSDETKVPRSHIVNWKQYHVSPIPDRPRSLLQRRAALRTLHLGLLWEELEGAREDGKRQGGEKAGGGGRRKMVLVGTSWHWCLQLLWNNEPGACFQGSYSFPSLLDPKDIYTLETFSVTANVWNMRTRYSSAHMFDPFLDRNPHFFGNEFEPIIHEILWKTNR